MKTLRAFTQCSSCNKLHQTGISIVPEFLAESASIVVFRALKLDGHNTANSIIITRETKPTDYQELGTEII